MNFRIFIIYIVFVLNLSVTSVYLVLDLLKNHIMGNLDITLLLVYDISSFIIVSELFKRDKDDGKSKTH